MGFSITGASSSSAVSSSAYVMHSMVSEVNENIPLAPPLIIYYSTFGFFFEGARALRTGLGFSSAPSSSTSDASLVAVAFMKMSAFRLKAPPFNCITFLTGAFFLGFAAGS